MTAAGVAAAALCAVAAYVLLGSRPPRRRLSALADRGSQLRDSSSALSQADDSAATDQAKSRVAVLSCILCGGALWLLVGGVSGVVLGLGIAALGPRLLGQMESRSTRARRLALDVAAPTVADLMAACLASGTSAVAATQATAEALGGDVGEVLTQCVVQFNLGAGPKRVWKPMCDEPALAPIARAILRSAETGAPLTSVLLRVADDLRVTRHARLDQAAKTVGVKAVGPLGLCFLPAFMLLGVVPLIASLISAGLAG